MTFQDKERLRTSHAFRTKANPHLNTPGPSWSGSCPPFLLLLHWRQSPIPYGALFSSSSQCLSPVCIICAVHSSHLHLLLPSYNSVCGPFSGKHPAPTCPTTNPLITKSGLITSPLALAIPDEYLNQSTEHTIMELSVEVSITTIRPYIPLEDTQRILYTFVFPKFTIIPKTKQSSESLLNKWKNEKSRREGEGRGEERRTEGNKGRG